MKTSVSTLVFFLFLVTNLFAQVEIKLTSPEGRDLDLFGSAVAINGDICVVGESGNTAWPYLKCGTVYSFKRNAETFEWELINYIDGDYNGNFFGDAISMDGDNIIIGCDVFKYELFTWSTGMQFGSAKIIRVNEDGTFSGNHFFLSDSVFMYGSAVSICGDLAIIGSPSDDENKNPNGYSSGAAYIYKKEGGIWHQVTKLMASDLTDRIGYDYYGEYVAISEKFAVVGCHGINKVYIYENVGDEWLESIINPYDSEFLTYIFSISISGNNLIIGCPIGEGTRPSGAASIYKMVDGEWRKTKVLTPNDNSIKDFGTSVYINDSLAIVGAPNPLGMGVCYIYKKQGEEWNETLKLSASNGLSNNLFGQSISFSEDKVIIGAPGEKFCINWDNEVEECLEYSRLYPGAAYIYEGLFSGNLEIDESSLNFGNVIIGESSSRTLEIKNQGLQSLNINTITISGTDRTSYSCTDEPFTLEAGESRNLTINFSPLSLRRLNASLRIESDGGSKTVSLTGNGSYALSVSPHTIAFGALIAGESEVATVNLRNIGDTNLVVDSIYISNTFGSDTIFKLDVEFPIELEPANSANFDVEFKPSIEGNYAGTINILSSVGDETVTLSGSGYYVGIPDVWPDTLSFGEVRIGQQATQQFYLGNTGLAPIRVGPMNLTGTGASDFRLNTDTLTILPGHHFYIDIHFFPGAEGPVTATLNTNTNAGNQKIELFGSGTAKGFLDVTPDTILFGEEKIQEGSSKQLLVGNFGVVDVIVSSITITGPDASAFYVDKTALNLAPAAITRLNIAYIPVNVGSHTANLELVSNGGNITVPLLGSCIICTPEPKTVVTPDDGMNGMGGFGYAVSISGNQAIVGGFMNSIDEGAAYIFGCDGTTWVQKDKLMPSEDAAFIDFGRSVDISGNYAVVGAPDYQKPDDQFLDGAAFVFSKQFMAGWNEVDRLEVDNEFFNAYLGQSVAIDDRTVIVGAPGTYIFPTKNVGAAYIFHGGSPAAGKGWDLISTLTAFDANENYGFGTSVDISGKYAIVGTTAYGAYVFQRSTPTAEGAWYFMQKLVSSDFQGDGYFGNQVAISGDYALVSAPFKPFTSMEGAVYLFKRTGIEWNEVGKIVSPYPSTYEYFGQSVALSGNFALIGTHQQETVYLFKIIEDDQLVTWELIESIYDDGIDPADGFGDCVALDASAGNGIIGLNGDFANNMFSGSAFIYSAFETTQTGIDEQEALDGSILKQNYPNPFTSTTVIPFSIEQRTFVSLKIIDILGQEIKTLVNDVLNAGKHEVTFNAKNLPEGLYFCKLQTGNSMNIKKMLLLSQP